MRMGNIDQSLDSNQNQNVDKKKARVGWVNICSNLAPTGIKVAEW